MKKDILELTNDIITKGKEQHILHHTTEDEFYNGRTIRLKGEEVINFGSYSYLGLETDQRLKDAAIDAIQRYGLQYPSSRSYASCTLYTELENLMRQLFKAPVVLATSTSLGHQAVIPILVEEGHVIIMDQQVHSSVRYAALNTQQEGVIVTIVRHNNLEELEKKIIEFSPKHKKIWYACDGVYSMYGDCAPLKELIVLLERYPKFHLYVDDAHGMSWAGTNGTGYTLSQVKLHPRMILATSLNKAFAAGGAVFVIPDEDLCEKIRNCGGPLIFAGQHQNAALGASIACAKIHLSEEINTLQKELADKIAYCQKLLEEYQLPIVSAPDTPIFFVGLGLARVGYRLVKYMLQEGYFVNLAIFPAVPEACTGVRFTITRHLTYEDINEMTAFLAYYFHLALHEEGRTMLDIQRAFRRIAHFKEAVLSLPEPKAAKPFTIQHESSIQKIPKAVWNNLLGSNGLFDWDGLHFLEETFKDNTEPENNWDFHYYIICDQYQKPVIATVFTVAIAKDDLLAPAIVSQKIEQQRKEDPYYLCSKTLMMGTLITEGQHIYIDRSISNWREAFTLLLDSLWQLQEEVEANSIYLRDFNAADAEIKEFLLAQGFLKLDMPDANMVDKPDWNTREDLVDRFHGKSRKHFKEDILRYEKYYETEKVEQLTKQDLDLYFSLYKNVKDKSYELNGFDLPKKFFSNLVHFKGGEIILLKLKPEYTDTRQVQTVSLTLNFITESNYYCGIVLGLNYDYVKSHNLYKQTLFRAALRSNQLHTRRFYMGLTAAQMKRKVGAVSIPQAAYVQIKDKYNVSVIAAIANQ